MPDIKYPGVYIEEIDPGMHPIEGVSTTVAAFVGFAENGALDPTSISSFAEYTDGFGGFGVSGYLPYAVQGFFQNGGVHCYVLNLAADMSDATVAVAPLGSLSDVSLVCCPDEHAVTGMTAALIAHCEQMHYRIAVLSSPPGSDLTNAPGVQSSYAAYYAPWVIVADSSGAPRAVHPGGHIVGVIANNDVQRGVSKAPANLAIEGIIGLEHQITEQQQTVLNPRGVNVLRSFPGRGNVIWGARTTSTDPEWKYVNIRRYLAYLEKSIEQGTQWVVFEPNGEQLWANVKQSIENFLLNEWESGALQGSKADQAYFVRCDQTTMTQDDIYNGRLICLVGVAVVKPAEFVIFRIGQWTAGANC